MRKNGRMPSRSSVIWLGTVQKRPFIVKRIAHSPDGCLWSGIRAAAGGCGARPKATLGELREVFPQRAAGLAREDFRERRDRARGFVEGDAFDAGHREEKRGQAGPLPFGAVDLIDEVIEGIQIDAAQSDARSVNGEEFSPKFFLG